MPTTTANTSLFTAALSPALPREALLVDAIGPGQKGDGVKRVQEWLTLGRIGVKVDGDYGPATEVAVRTFQLRESLPDTGSVDGDTFGSLTSGLAKAVAPITPSASFGADMVRCGEQHVAQHPREIGGANRGPWVRLYMDGAEGTEFPWCAGFARFLMRQASNGRALPFTPSISCDECARSGKQRGLFRDGSTITPAEITPGSLFLVRRKDAPGWHHTGIVVSATGNTIRTIEGNTNDDGSREGYEAIQRVRVLANVDYIIMPS
jgi:peptidoglycan hydrolase-like protein with peptidoglycan-binding domain